MPNKHLELAVKALSVEPLTPGSTVALANISRALALLTYSPSVVDKLAPDVVRKKPGRKPKALLDQAIDQKNKVKGKPGRKPKAVLGQAADQKNEEVKAG